MLTRPRIRGVLTVTGSPGWSNLVEAAGGWTGIVLSNARNQDNAKFQGRSLAAIAAPRDWRWRALVRPTDEGSAADEPRCA